MLTKNAVGNLINRYQSVLAKCRMLNILGTQTLISLTLATVLATGASTGIAHADTVTDLSDEIISDEISGHTTLTRGDLTLSGIAQSDEVDALDTTTIEDGATLTLTGSMDGQAVSVPNGGTIVNYSVLNVGLGDGTITVGGTLNVSGTITWDTSDGENTNNITANNGANVITSTSNIYI